MVEASRSGGRVTFALVHLECISCEALAWATVPAVVMDGPFACSTCEELSMLPILGEPVHLVAGDSYLAYDWYYQHPEQVLLEVPCQ
jgi:hypothetical protein